MAIALVQDLDRLPRLDTEDIVNLRIDRSIDLEKFQGALFRWIVVNRSRFAKVTLEAKIPATCHFANILESLGITIEVEGDV